MYTKVYRQLASTLTVCILAALPVWGQTASKAKEPLKDRDNPLLIGKRDINKGQMNFYSVEKEVAFGRQMAMEVDRESKQITDPVVLEFINRVTQNIVLHSDAKVPFTVKVLDTDDVNAFALPGGFLYVNRGLIEAADSEAELAGVMAHEIAHVAARHGMEQYSKGTFINYASIPLLFFGGLPGYIVQQVAGLAVPLTFLKFSRGAEKEADRLGAQYMWAAGYDPQALSTFFEKLKAQDKRKPGTLSKLFSTHPYTGDRISEVEKLVAQFPERGEYQLSTSEFKDVKTRVLAASATSHAAAAAADARRPTLKRRPQNTGDRGDVGTDDRNSTDDRPVLKRRDGTEAADTKPADDAGERPVLKRTESSGETAKPAEKEKTPDSGNRPVLKRREGSASDEETKPAEKTGETTERPVLKRRPDSGNEDSGDS
jgi:predicted Zn-dependent protease